jgi:hypothetical protein
MGLQPYFRNSAEVLAGAGTLICKGNEYDHAFPYMDTAQLEEREISPSSVWKIAGNETIKLMQPGVWSPETSVQLNISQAVVPREIERVQTPEIMPQLDVKISSQVVLSRIVAGGIDMQFELSAYKDRDIVDTRRIGRTWGWEVTHFPESVIGPWKYPGIKIIPAQAYAGLTRGVTDQNVIRSLSALSSIFGTVKENMISDLARTAINRMLGKRYQPVHLFMRLASLYVAAVQLEHSDRHLNVIGELSHDRQLFVGSWNSFSRVVHNSEQKFYNPLPFLPRACVEPNAFYRVLVGCILGHDVLDAAGNLPCILRIWPPINEVRLIHYSDAKLEFQATGTINSLDVASVISFYANVFGLQSMAHDAVRTAFTLCHRVPDSPDATLLGYREMFDIGHCDMSAWSLIHIIQPEQFISTENILSIFDEPELELFGGLVRSMAMSHAHNMVLAAAGINVLAAGWKDQQISANITSLFKTTAHIQPIMAATLSTAKMLLGQGCSGPLMDRYKLLGRSIKDAALANFRRGLWVQAEELIPVSGSMLKDTSLMGHITPAAPLQLLTMKTLHRVSQVVGAIDRCSAFYSLLETTKKTKYHSVQYTAGTFIPTLKHYKPVLSYRGIPLDGQFCDFRAAGTQYGMAFAINAGTDAHAAQNLPYLRSKLTWWYDWYTPSQFNWNAAYGHEEGFTSQPGMQQFLDDEHPTDEPAEPADTQDIETTKDEEPTPKVLEAKQQKPMESILKAFGPAQILFEATLNRLYETRSIHDASSHASKLADTLLAMDIEDTMHNFAENNVTDEGLRFILEVADLIEANDTRTATAQRLSGLRVDYMTMLSQLQREQISDEKKIKDMTSATSIEELEEKTNETELARAIDEDVHAIEELAKAETAHIGDTGQGKVGAPGSAADPGAQSAATSSQQMFTDVDFAIPRQLHSTV